MDSTSVEEPSALIWIPAAAWGVSRVLVISLVIVVLPRIVSLKESVVDLDC